MKAAGLRAIDTVVSSTAVLVKSRGANSELLDLLVSRIRGVISTFLPLHHSLPFLLSPYTIPNPSLFFFHLAAKRYVLCQYNVPRTLLSAACRITPGKRAPTVTALEETDWVAVSAMVEKKAVATVMDGLTGVGATDILVLEIANSRTQ